MRARLAQDAPRHYLRPALLRLGQGSEVGARVPFEQLVERLGAYQRRTWMVIGGPGSGKSSVVNQLAVELLGRGVACVVVTGRSLRHRTSVGPKARDFAVEACPAEVDKPLWKALVKRGHVVFLVDAVNELEREFGGTPKWDLVRAILEGEPAHQYPVLATTRSELAGLGSSHLREIESLSLAPLTEQETDRYFESRGIEPRNARTEVDAAGLTSAISNPYLLSLLTDWMQSDDHAAGRSFPSSRAELLERTVVRAQLEGRLSEPAAGVGQAALSMEAALCAASLCAFVSRSEAEFRRADLVALLRRVWPDAGEAEAATQAFVDTQMVDSIATDPVAERARLSLSHPALVDFGLALGWRSVSPPALAWEPDYLDQCLGDWVGLQPNPDEAASRLLAFGRAGPRYDTLVDVLVANRGVLSPETQSRYWEQLSLGFASDRAARDGLATALARMPAGLIREGIRNGLLKDVGLGGAELAADVARALQRRTLTAQSMQQLRRKHQRRVTAELTAGPGESPDVDLVEQRIRTLRTSGNIDSKRRSANWLGSYGGEQAIPVLISAMTTDESPIVQGSAATALGKLGGPAAVPPLLDVLGSSGSASVRGSAATALGSLRSRDAVPALVELLSDRSAEPSPRGSAATALGNIGSPEAVPALIAAVGETSADGAVRGSAASALGSIGGPGAAQALIALVADPTADGGARSSAAKALGSIGGPEAAPALIAVVSDPSADGAARGSAAHALGTIGGPEAVPALLEVMADVSAEASIRGSAANALGHIGSPEAVPALATLLSDPSATDRTRCSAATALGNVGSLAAVPALVEVVADGSAAGSVRGSAAMALGNMGSSEAVPALAGLLGDSSADEATRGAAATALGNIGSPEAVPALAEVLDDVSAVSAVRGSAVAALGRLSDPRVLPTIEKVVVAEEEDYWTRVSAVQAAGSLGAALGPWITEAADEVLQKRTLPGSPARKFRGAIVNLVSRHANEPALAQWLDRVARTDPDPLNRTAAIAGLSKAHCIDPSLIRYTIAPDPPRSDKRLRDTDNGVCGVAAGAAIRFAETDFAVFEALLGGVVDLLANPETWSSTVNAAVSVVAQLPLDIASQTLAAFEQSVEGRRHDNTWLDAALGRQRVLIEQRKRAIADFQHIREAPERVLQNLTAERESRFDPMDVHSNADVAVLTAIPIETKMLYQALSDRGFRTEQVQRSGRYFDLYEIPSDSGRAVRLVVTQATDKGGQSASAVTHDVISAFGPELVMLVGVCGGLGERGVSLGDVLLAKNVFNYDPERVQPGADGGRPQTFRCDEQVLRLATYLSTRGVLEATLAGHKLHLKDYASGEKVIAWGDSSIRQAIAALSIDVYGIETEAHGVMHAIWETFKAERFVGGAVVKCVSDLGDEEMGVDKGAKQAEAARRAAEIAMSSPARSDAASTTAEVRAPLR